MDDPRSINALEHVMRYGDPGGQKRMELATKREEGMRKVYYDYKDVFASSIGVPLSQYFDVNRGGFQAQAFTTQVLEYEGPVPGVACAKLFGKRAQNMIASMMHDCAEVMNDHDPGR